ncbi:MAG: adenine deaminase [Clostridia bacterium]|nr:adenine deaminase [Clostridia bacterium]
MDYKIRTCAEELSRRVMVAAGKRKADLVLKNAEFLNVFTGEICKGDIAVQDGKIAAIGSYDGEKEIDLAGKGVCTPGLTDGHIHIESTQLTPEEFASACMPCGTSVVIADPHEIVNVCGIDGARYIARAAGRTPLEVKLMLPSCVPATAFETSGATLDAEETAKAMESSLFYGLGEMMSYPAIVNGDTEVLSKVASAVVCGKPADGHSPSLTGKDLAAYICTGIKTDHECATAEEAAERVAMGMYVLLREGSASHELKKLAPAVNGRNYRRFLICTDDRHADDLLSEGHINNALRVAVKSGIPAEQAVTMATLNAAECYGLTGKGAIAPGYDADIAVFDNLTDFNCKLAIKRGKVVAVEGKPLFKAVKRLDKCVKDTVHLGEMTADRFVINLKGTRARVMRIEEGSLVTKSEVCEVGSCGGDVDIKGTDVLKVAVVERHRGSGNVGLGLIKGYGLKGGAIAISVGHDSHNITVIGDDNGAMAKAVNELKRIGGGMALVSGESVYSHPLEVAGLMSSAPASKHVAALHDLSQKAHAMGVKEYYDPFMTLSFLSLAVIPELRVTDRGLFDVTAFNFADINA